MAADVAPDIGYKRSSVDHFLRGSYGKLCRDQLYMRHAVWEFISRQPVQDDEEIPTKLLPTHDTKLILERIQEAHSKHRIVVIEGPPGTCKTTTLRWYEAERNRRQRADAFYVRAFTQITGHGLLKELAVRVGRLRCPAAGTSLAKPGAQAARAQAQRAAGGRSAEPAGRPARKRSSRSVM